MRNPTTYERVCVKLFSWNREHEPIHYNYNHDDADLDTDTGSSGIPTCCRTFHSANYNTSSCGNLYRYPFKATSSSFERSNQSRSTSFVRFERSIVANGREERRQSHFREVFFFFTIDLPEESICDCANRTTIIGQRSLRVAERERGPVRENRENELLLAYIRHFPVQKDGRLLYRNGDGTLLVIMAKDIRELIGLLNKGNKQYIVRKHTALF